MLKIELVARTMEKGNIAVDVFINGQASVYEIHAMKTFIEKQLGDEIVSRVPEESRMAFEELDSELTTIIPLGENRCLH